MNTSHRFAKLRCEDDVQSCPRESSSDDQSRALSKKTECSMLRVIDVPVT